jgi:sorting nexin-7/30/sorting nexin-8
MSDDPQLTLKQEILKSEILEKNYDKDKFIQFCLNQKENGDDLTKWTLLELNECISQFIKVENEAQNPQSQMNINNQNNINYSYNPNNYQQQLNSQQIMQNQNIQNINNNLQQVQTTNNTPPVKESDKFKAAMNKDILPMDFLPTDKSLLTTNDILCKKLDKTEFNNVDISVIIRDPKTNEKKFYETSYVTYEIVTSPLNYLVRRRFSDFDWLRNILQKFFPRIFLPPLPNKKIGNRRFESDFVQKRMEKLQVFINYIIKREELKSSEALVSFLKFTDRNQFESKMKELNSFLPSPFCEDQKTLNGILKINNNYELEKYFMNIANFFKIENGLYERLNYNLKNFYVNIAYACKSLENAEKDFDTLSQLNAKVNMSKEITNSFEEYSIFYKNWKNILSNQNEIFKTKIKNFFKYQNKLNVSYSELINSREQLRNKFLNENTKLNSKKEKLFIIKDINKWEIDEFLNPNERDKLFIDKDFAFSKMCTKDNQSVNNIFKQLGYANYTNLIELNKIIEERKKIFVENMKSFTEEFYPTLTDGINVWTTLTNYM